MLRSLLSVNTASQAETKKTRLATATNIILNEQTFKACMNKCTHHISKHVQASCSDSLIDGGCNVVLEGDDVAVLEESTQLVDITGISGSKIESVPIKTVMGLISTTEGPIIGFFHQYAAYGKVSTIHTVNQLCYFGLEVNDIPTSCYGGEQCICTSDGHKIPLAVRESLCYMDMRVPTDDGFVHLDSFLCAATTKPGFLLPMSPVGTKMCQQTHSCLMFPLIMMASLGMEVVLWRRFIPALLSILQKVIRNY